MKKSILGITLLVFMTSYAVARVGGGRSFSGSRGGSRSFGSSPRMAPSRPYEAPRREVPTPGQTNPYQGSPAQGGFLRNMAGGLAGGFLGSMLFGGMGGGLGGSGGGRAGFGLMELLLLGGLAFVIFRYFRQQKRPVSFGNGATMGTAFSPYNNSQPLSNAEVGSREGTGGESADFESQFNLPSFKEARTDDFFKVQAAFSNRDLSAVRENISEELSLQLSEDIEALKRQQHINHIDNIAMRAADVIEAWREFEKEYATFRFTANVLDYTTDEKTGAVVGGDKNTPIKFVEDWTFVRSVPRNLPAKNWKLSAIEVV